MHEMSLINDLMKKIEDVRTSNKALSVKSVCVKIGALAHISGDHFRGHFVEAAAGTKSEKAKLEIIESKDINDPNAQDIILKNIELEIDGE